MRTNKLQFSQFQQEFAVLEKEDLRGVVGGVALEWATDPAGNYYWREVGSDIWNACSTLEGVTITAPGRPSNLPFGINPFGDGSGGGNAGGSISIPRTPSTSTIPTSDL